MAIKFYKLYDILKRRGLKSKDLVEKKILSPASMAKLSNNQNVNIQTIDKLCEFLDVQPGDIMEYIKEEKPKEEIS